MINHVCVNFNIRILRRKDFVNWKIVVVNVTIGTPFVSSKIDIVVRIGCIDGVVIE